jgi:hypothetical protein
MGNRFIGGVMVEGISSADRLCGFAQVRSRIAFAAAIRA